MTTFGFVTIGQSPRTDVLRSMLPETDTSALPQAGALDGLGPDTILDLRPRDGENPLVTRLRDGSEVVVAKPRLLLHIESAISDVQSRGASAAVVLCTGEFPTLHSPIPVIYPDRVLTATVNAVFPAGTLGVIMPHADQRDTMLAKWQPTNRRVVTGTASPYTSAGELEGVARGLVDHGAEMILLDCMGFDAAMRARVSASVNAPVVLANRLVGRVLEELMVTPVATPATGGS